MSDKHSIRFILLIKQVIICFTLLSCIMSFAQTETETLEKDIRAYIEANNSNDYQAQLKFCPKFVLESTSEEDLLYQLQASSSDERTQMAIDSLFTIEKLITIDNQEYSRIQMQYNITIDLSEFKGKGGMDYAILSAKNALAAEYGSENVVFNKEEWRFNFTQNVVMIGLKEESWTFAALNPMTETFIPDGIKN